ncbi:ABC transporter permease [Curtobacterium flaccumfaciens]|uniref:ABC transporter permease n=1 Tax=Curtobacterium TaxID=2034 RepID=UPI00217ED66E|nr:ABC transporter permease [Curtobacterium flaccumfaciens]MCS6561249.1 ABC transporter permease [Curtobacterium flaccumfaciens pv. poinsettiae]UXN26761.1 ABC transporter permease [Curtobacterium flaccumfaciens]UXN29402.1 ABC transporter permease [Curtobacterium flaccumfaciens]
MTAFVLRRTGSMLGVLVALTIVLFSLQELSGVDPARAYVGANASAGAVDRARASLGLDQPAPIRYLAYLGGLLHGDLQNSLRTRTPVAEGIATAFPATLELAMWTLAIALLLGAAFAFLTVTRWRGAGVVRIVLLSGAAAPTFLLASVGLLFLYGKLGLVPANGRSSFTESSPGPTGLLVVDAVLAGRVDVAGDAVWHLLLPAACAAVSPAVAIGRVLVDGLRTNLVADHARTARSAGMRESAVLLRHALRNALGPTLSMIGLQAGMLLGGLVVVEKIVGWPGLGSYLDRSVQSSDFPGIAGVALLLGVSFVVLNTVVDLLQVVVDRRLALA